MKLFFFIAAAFCLIAGAFAQIGAGLQSGPAGVGLQTGFVPNQYGASGVQTGMQTPYGGVQGQMANGKK